MIEVVNMIATSNIQNKVANLIDDLVMESQRELTLKECCLRPFVFFHFCRVFLVAYTKDWQRPYRGISAWVSFLTYSLTFSLFSSSIFMLVAIMATTQPHQISMLSLGSIVGLLSGYIFTIQKERELANKKLRSIQGMEKLEKWKTLGLLDIYHRPRKN